MKVVLLFNQIKLGYGDREYPKSSKTEQYRRLQRLHVGAK